MSIKSKKSLTAEDKVFNNTYLIKEILKWLRFKYNTSPLKLLMYRRINHLFNETILTKMAKRTWWSLTNLRIDLSTHSEPYTIFDKWGNLYKSKDYIYNGGSLIKMRKPRTRISIFNLINFLRFINFYDINYHYHGEFPMIMWNDWWESHADDMRNPDVKWVRPPSNIILIHSNYKLKYKKE